MKILNISFPMVEIDPRTCHDFLKGRRSSIAQLYKCNGCGVDSQSSECVISIYSPW